MYTAGSLMAVAKGISRDSLLAVALSGVKITFPTISDVS
jgi:hypothetical protein